MKNLEFGEHLWVRRVIFIGRSKRREENTNKRKAEANGEEMTWEKDEDEKANEILEPMACEVGRVGGWNTIRHDEAIAWMASSKVAGNSCFGH